MFCILFFASSFSVAIASPLIVGSDEWDSWFSSQSNVLDAQTLPQLNSVSFEKDMPYLSDLGSDQIGSDDNMFGSSDETLISMHGDPGIAVANSGSWADNELMTEALISGPVPQAATDLGSFAGQDQLAQLPTTPSPEAKVHWFIPSTANPCPRIETYCCTGPQYTLVLYVNKESCRPCMTHA